MALESINLTDLGARLGLDGATATLTGPAEALALSTSSLVDLDGSDAAPILVMSTGLAADILNDNIAGDQGVDLGLEGGINDDIILTLNFTKDEADNYFSFDMTFLSEEFDEFLNRGFDDFFTATLNGAEVSSVTVDTAGFNAGLSTEGTQFDARNDTLRFITRIDTDQINNTLELRIADEGDGRLDSAAFLNNFNLTANTIFVDFDGGDVMFDTLLEDDLTFAMPAAVLTDAEKALILDGGTDPATGEQLPGVRGIFNGFAVEFVTERPDFDDFATIHVGGAFADLPEFLQSDETIISLSEGIDPGNSINADQAFVLSQEAVEADGLGAKVGLLAQAIARESAHLLGLRNVEDREAVVFPTPGETRTDLNVVSAIAALADDGSITTFPVAQAIPNELSNNVGLVGANTRPEDSLAETLQKVVVIETGESAETIFGLRAAVVDSDGNILSLTDLGDLEGGDVATFTASAIDSDRVVLIAKSDAAVDFDLFLGSRDADGFSFADQSQAQIFDALGAPITDFQSAVFSFVSDADLALPVDPIEIRTNVIAQPEVAGTDGADTLTADPSGGALIGRAGDDLLTGDAGADGLFGGDGADTASGGAGDDDIRGGDGDDSLSGGDGADLISGGAGADRIDAGAGADTIFATLGDVIDGGLGTDILETELVFADVALTDGDPGFVFTTVDGVLTATGVEEFRFADRTLSSADLAALLAPDQPGDVDGDEAEAGDDGDQIDGGEANDTLNGGAGEDEIAGAGGDDLIAAGDGDDQVQGGQGDDTIRGQAGEDAIIGGGGDDSLMGGGGADALTGGGGDDTIKGGGGDDVLLGGFGQDRLGGGGGADDLNGGAGADFVRGGGGNDGLRGGGGADALNGGGGDDVLNGGRGDDVLRGRAGDDVFQFRTGDGDDRIKDFQQGQDRIEILRGAEEFSDLSIDQVGANVRISFSNVSILVERQDSDDFSAADFIF